MVADVELTYLDHAATTPLGEGVLEAMLPYLGAEFANPSGAYRFARRARLAVDEAREQIAGLAGWDPGSVIFTSGGTEADNMVVAGRLALGAGPAVCSAVEHHAVLAAVERGEHRLVGVDGYGRVDLDLLAAALQPNTAVVSVIAVNNEVGAINDLAAVADVVRARSPQALLHTDAVQAAAWLPLATLCAEVHALSLSAHKVGGPKGVGALLLAPGQRVAPLLVGGGQERDRRSGTTNVAGVVGMAAALLATQRSLAPTAARLGALRDRLVGAILAALTEVRETVPAAHKVAGSAHLLIAGVDSESLLFLLDQRGVCASAASACASGAMQRSHVLAAMGIEARWSAGALRLTLGATTTEADVERGAAAVIESVEALRARRAGRHGAVR